MKAHSSENLRWYGLVAGMAAVLAMLAALQYRSVEQVSKAKTEQMLSGLSGSLLDVRQ